MIDRREVSHILLPAGAGVLVMAAAIALAAFAAALV